MHRGGQLVVAGDWPLLLHWWWRLLVDLCWSWNMLLEGEAEAGLPGPVAPLASTGVGRPHGTWGARGGPGG